VGRFAGVEYGHRERWRAHLLRSHDSFLIDLYALRSMLSNNTKFIHSCEKHGWEIGSTSQGQDLLHSMTWSYVVTQCARVQFN